MFRRHDRPARLLDPRRAGGRVGARRPRPRPRPPAAQHDRLGAPGARRRRRTSSTRRAPRRTPSARRAGHARRRSTTTAPASPPPTATSLVTALSTPEGAPVDLADGARPPRPRGRRRRAVAAGRRSSPRSPSSSRRSSRDERFWLDRLAAGRARRRRRSAAPDGAAATATVERPAGADDATVARRGRAVARPHHGRADASRSPSPTPARRDVLDRIAPLARPGVAVLDVDAGRDVRRRCAPRPPPSSTTLAPPQPLLRDAIGREPRTRGHGSSPRRCVVELGGADAAVRRRRRGAAHRRRRRPRRCSTRRSTRPTRTRSTASPSSSRRCSRPGSPSPATPCGRPAAARAGRAGAARRDQRHRRSTTTARRRSTRCSTPRSARTPDAPALSFGRPHAHLRRAARPRSARSPAGSPAAGVGRGDRVGIAVPRGVDMVVGVLATLDLGAAYLPLDPTYPIERLEFMVDDAGIAVLLADRRDGAPSWPARTSPSLDPADAGEPATARRRRSSTTRPTSPTSSTRRARPGTPKGVMLEHRQVDNFFAAMDQVIDPDPPGVWLAVTSLSFDISVLELLWTLTRGFHVVLKSDRGVSVATAEPASPTPAPPGDVQPLLLRRRRGRRRRRLPAAARERPLRRPQRLRGGVDARAPLPRLRRRLPEPERHRRRARGDHRATSASAPAASCCRCTRRSASPRSGRSSTTSRAAASAISFAAGWQPNDFVLNPTAYATAKEDLPRNIELVQRLWRGETVALPGHDGAPVDVRTLPRPVQAELPVWLTSAGIAGDVRAGRHARRQRAHPPARPVRRAARREHRPLPRGVARRPATPARAASR